MRSSENKNINVEKNEEISPRDKIYSVIIQNPGLHFREIQRRCDFATGLVQYHLNYLLRKGFIKEEKEGKFSRYYSVKTEVNTKLMNLLRQEKVRRIILVLLNNNYLSQKEIAKKANFSSSITKFHLSKLMDEGIVKESKKGFYIEEKEPLFELLIIYKKSFFDNLVDNFINLWEKELAMEFDK